MSDSVRYRTALDGMSTSVAELQSLVKNAETLGAAALRTLYSRLAAVESGFSSLKLYADRSVAASIVHLSEEYQQAAAVVRTYRRSGRREASDYLQYLTGLREVSRMIREELARIEAFVGTEKRRYERRRSDLRSRVNPGLVRLNVDRPNSSGSRSSSSDDDDTVAG